MPTPKPKKKATTPPPRAIAVLEWAPVAASPSGPKLAVSDPKARSKALSTPATVAPSKTDPPKEARLIPVSVFYDGAYQDAGVYMSQPAPLALLADTVYDLEKSGDPAGSFTLSGASRHDDAWQATGTYAPIPPPKPVKENVHIALGAHADDDSDRPVLKRRHAEPDATAPPAAGTSSSASKPAPASSDSSKPPMSSDDPDRPKLHRAPAAQTPDTSAPAAATSTNPAEAANKPGVATDPKTSDDYLNPADDATRPHIKRGVYREHAPPLPGLLGNPANLKQTVAVSDAARTDDHTFVHAWLNDEERNRAQQAMQQLALAQIDKWKKSMPAPGANPAAATKPVAQRRSAHPAKTGASPALQLTAVQFAAFDLAFQDEPTYVFAGQTTEEGRAQTFVALVARPDIYGNLQIVFSSVTNGVELALTPRYRLVDAVDSNGDGRAELLLEARNLEGRRFVLLDVYRGEAQKVFETGMIP